MLEIKYIRENIEAIRKGAADKRINFDLDRLLELDQQIKPVQLDLEALQAERNKLSKTIGKAAPEEREALKATVGEIKVKMEGRSEELNTLREEFDALMLLVPQPARADVPVGKDDNDNIEVRTWGTPKQPDFKIRDHVELGELHDMIDIERGVKMAGSRSYIIKGDGVRVEQAIMRFVFDKLVAKGYVPMTVPVLVTEQCMQGTGYFPTGRDQAYYIEKDHLALIGTAEVALTSYHADEIIDPKKLPLKFVSWSSCFRREAGTYGKDTHGLYRVHQFQKIEQVAICSANAEESERIHDELLGNAEEIMQALELPYRVVYVCTGDLGQGQLRKHDIETWMPSRESYGETHSCSTFHDFQARRLKTRYKDESGKTTYCHTLNNTAAATPRLLIPFLENHQDADGSINIPPCLQPYLQGQSKITVSGDRAK